VRHGQNELKGSGQLKKKEGSRSLRKKAQGDGQKGIQFSYHKSQMPRNPPQEKKNALKVEKKLRSMIICLLFIFT
jgi:hypothetical protein